MSQHVAVSAFPPCSRHAVWVINDGDGMARWDRTHGDGEREGADL